LELWDRVEDLDRYLGFLSRRDQMKVAWQFTARDAVKNDPSRREPEVVCKFFYEEFFTVASGEPRLARARR